jgi:prophage regulatory protein
MEMESTILRRREVEQITGLSRSSIYERMNIRSRYYDPDFPKPVRLGQRAVGWRASEIAAWIDSRKSSAA